MSRAKKVVSKKMAKLLEKQAMLKAIKKANKQGYKAFVKAENSLYDVETKLEAAKI
jgi:hypothetical protein